MPLAAPKPFEIVLGDVMARLPHAVRRLHGLDQALSTSGRAEIVTDKGFAKWLLCWFAGMPKAGLDVPVSVLFAPDGKGGEHWLRDFAGRRYASRMEAGRGSDDGHLVERFGLFDLVFRLDARDDGLGWTLVRWRWLGLPLPAWTLPRIVCLEHGAGGRFHFDIDVAFPFLGPVLRYKGWLEPLADRAAIA